jgi:hypothetical protein
MWRYAQSTGILTHDEQSVACGYSGCGDAKNRPECQAIKCEGPIPQGVWAIVAVFDSSTHGPFCLRLAPKPSTDTFGRDGFLIHGDSVKFPGEASQGCIILPRRVREDIWRSEDTELEVVA